MKLTVLGETFSVFQLVAAVGVLALLWAGFSGFIVVLSPVVQ